MVSAKEVQETLAGAAIHKKWANDYRTDDVEPLLRIYFRYLVDRLGLRPDMRILDAGCGTAFQAIRLAKMGFQVDAVDYSAFAVEEANRAIAESGLTDRVKVWQGDVTGLDMPDNSYDAVFCLAVLMHVPDIDAAIKELARIVKPGGVLLISEENRDAPEYWLHRFYWRFGRKQNVRVEQGVGFTNAWIDLGTAWLLTRAVSKKWIIERFERAGMEFWWLKSGMLTGLYSRVRGFKRRVILKLNQGWFRFGGPSALSAGHYIAFRKPE
jgi:SAM-dependent methyltransferase